MKKSSSRIIHVGPDINYPYGGMAKLLKLYSEFFPEFKFVTTYRSLKEGQENNFKKVYRFIGGLIKYISLLSNKNNKIVHIHSASGTSFYRKSIFIILSKIFNKKTILHIHGGEFQNFYLKNNRYSKFILNKVDKIITIAKIWEEFLIDEGFKNTVTLNNPINTPITRNDNNVDSNLTKILFLGTLNQNKGIWDIVRMVIENKTKLINHVKFIIGGNGDVNKLISIIKENNLSEIIEFVGWIDDKSKPDYFNMADIYIQPSYKEGLGLAILEAMSYSKPVIASNVGGIPQIVKNNFNGVLIEPGNTKEILNAILELSKSKKFRQEMGKRGKEIASNYFPNKVKRDLQTIYNDVLTNN